MVVYLLEEPRDRDPKTFQNRTSGGAGRSLGASAFTTDALAKATHQDGAQDERDERSQYRAHVGAAAREARRSAQKRKPHERNLGEAERAHEPVGAITRRTHCVEG
jgi:hypothetical protein